MVRTKKVLAFILTIALIFSYTPGYAINNSDFLDMPNDWSTEALKACVENGLLMGSNNKLAPQGNLTRAEMATILSRAFGATQKTNLKGVKDVPGNAWYESAMAKAVYMKIYMLDLQLRPNSKITRQEVFTALARAFKLECKDKSHAELNKFADKNKIASWAVDSICALAQNGYIGGADGKINPEANITRAEFAQLMHNIVKQYISENGIVTKVVDNGNVMVNSPNAVLKDLTVNGDLIIGDGVGEGDLTLENVNVLGKVIVRGGGVNSIKIIGNSNVKNVVVAKVDGNVRVNVSAEASVEVVSINDGKNDVIVEGNIKNLVVESAEAPVIVKNAAIENISVNVPNTDLKVDQQSKVTNVDVAKAASNTVVKIEGTVANLNTEAPNTGLQVEKNAAVGSVVVSETAQSSIVKVDGKVSNLKTEAPNVGVSVTGTVEKVEISKTASSTTVEISKDATVKDMVNSGEGTTLGGEGKPDKIEGNAPEVVKPNPNPTPGGSGGGDPTPPTPTVSVTGVTLNTTSAAITVGENLTLTATVNPADATNKNVTWSSSDVTVATVTNGEVTALKAGTATITVTAEDGDGMHTATCEVTVTGGSVPSTEATIVGYALAGVNNGTLGTPATTPGAITSVGAISITSGSAISATLTVTGTAIGANVKYAYTSSDNIPASFTDWTATNVENNSYIWIEVTAEDNVTKNVYKIKVTVTE